MTSQALPHGHGLLPLALRAGAVCLVATVVAFTWIKVTSSDPRIHETAQVITLVDEPLEPPPVAEELPEEVPEEAEPLEEPDAPEMDGPDPLDDSLALDADAEAGSDSFGLLARRGGRDLLTLGAGDGGQAYRSYGIVVEDGLREALMAREELRRRSYSAIVRLWIQADGAIGRAELAEGTGVAAIDQAIERAISGAARLARPPPADMPQPVRIRVTATAG